ncbi:hypothetical protein [Actinoplanes sp. N902-109]|uniref:hypothetical protein n=1 Tax=Actinoplanes sp. (strain N902-109) TaxID=649831 RepID=UPI0012F78618|nr:hypothetical protein [Actinoplanes sp. N902-109]
MTALFSTVGGLLDRRQLTVVWMPLLAFLGGLGVVVVTGLGVKEAQAWWAGASGEVRTMAGGALIIVTVLLGQTLNAWRTGLIRLFSGYWPDAPGLRTVRDHLTARHRRVQARRAAADPELFLSYPRRAEHVLPTRLGNVIRAAEEHADRYGIDGVTAWPRLYVVLPASFLEAFSATTASMEGATVIGVLGAAFAVAGGVLAALLLPPLAAAATVLLGAAVAVLGHRAATRAAAPYAQLIRTAFDVHRFALLEAMRLQLPTGFPEEREQWRQLGKLWYQGWPDSDRASALRYPQPAPPEPATAPAAAVASLAAVASPSAIAVTPPAPAVAASATPVTETPTPTPAAPARRGMPVRSLLAAAVILFAAAAGVVAATRTDDSPSEARAARGLPAFHVLTRHDITGPRADRLIGRYTLSAVKADDPLRARELGPVLPTGLAGRSVLAVPADRAVDRGTEVDLVVTPFQGEDLRRFTGLIVLDQAAEPPSVTVAVPYADVDLLLAAVDAGTAHLVLR